ncbi:hypothetical protein CYLTODRAFT_490042 [Cylindrobasidium torrendii FP15055 ss-10]|uniref:Uncharacterized protein n=1 Tax=Cylindrobasidium torrendii FP15055 ss-10 TaxID=1314674 RepID=A0A0D7BD95_9AGAR|nr:hypothetical protein CYLTODRAFT_490042 [Cylindrobasidium torrendii FP15055 ss-10]
MPALPSFMSLSRHRNKSKSTKLPLEEPGTLNILQSQSLRGSRDVFDIDNAGGESRGATLGRMQLDASLPKRESNWFTGHLSTSAPTNLNNVKTTPSRGLKRGKNGELYYDYDDDLARSEDAIANLEALTGVNGYNSTTELTRTPSSDGNNAAAGSSRKPKTTPAPIIIPTSSHSTLDHGEEAIDPSPMLARPKSHESLDGWSAVSGSTLARALLANPFALSENGTMLSTVSRLDSAVLPRNEEGFPSRAPTRRNTPPPDILEDPQAHSVDAELDSGSSKEVVLPALMLDSTLLNTSSSGIANETSSDSYLGDSGEHVAPPEIVTDRTFKTAQEEAIARGASRRLASETSQDGRDMDSDSTSTASPSQTKSSHYPSKVKIMPMGRSLSNVSASNRLEMLELSRTLSLREAPQGRLSLLPIGPRPKQSKDTSGPRHHSFSSSMILSESMRPHSMETPGASTISRPSEQRDSVSSSHVGPTIPNGHFSEPVPPATTEMRHPRVNSIERLHISLPAVSPLRTRHSSPASTLGLEQNLPALPSSPVSPNSRSPQDADIPRSPAPSTIYLVGSDTPLLVPPPPPMAPPPPPPPAPPQHTGTYLSRPPETLRATPLSPLVERSEESWSPRTTEESGRMVGTSINASEGPPVIPSAGFHARAASHPSILTTTHRHCLSWDNHSSSHNHDHEQQSIPMGSPPSYEYVVSLDETASSSSHSSHSAPRDSISSLSSVTDSVSSTTTVRRRRTTRAPIGPRQPARDRSSFPPVTRTVEEQEATSNIQAQARTFASPLIPSPALEFPTPPLPLRGYSLDAARLAFTPQQLEDIVANAIRWSADPSSVRLLQQEAVDVQIPLRLEALIERRAQLQHKYKLEVRRRTDLFDQILRGDAHVGIHELKVLCVSLDDMSAELHAVDEQVAQLNTLVHFHKSSALAIALQKVNHAFLDGFSRAQGLKKQVQALQADRDEAWYLAEAAARDLQEMAHLEDSVDSPWCRTNTALKRLSSLRASRPASMISVHSSSGLRSAMDIPPVPPIMWKDISSPPLDNARIFEADLGRVYDELHEMLGLPVPHDRPTLRRARSLMKPSTEVEVGFRQDNCIRLSRPRSLPNLLAVEP